MDLPRGVRARIEANLEALETARTLEQRGRHGSADEVSTLAGYTGWGGLVDVFDETDETYQTARHRLREAVSEQAYHTLRGSILNAHYTPPELAEAIWDPIREAAQGREDLRVLEPGSGTGMFFRTSGLTGSETGHQFVGVEVDETSARICSLLHPEAEVHHVGFESTRFQEDSFDLTIGNVPFGDWSLPDTRHNTAGLSLHNHFIYKSLAHTAPGGYVAVVSSRYTMDSKNETARRAFARHGDLVGAVRLPEGAHQHLSGTTVGTDVLIFRRRHPEAEPEDTSTWVELETTTVTDAEGVPHEVGFNRYFAQNPHRVIGEVEHSSNPFGPGYQVRAEAQTDVAAAVRAQITEITTSTNLELNPARVETPEFTPGLLTAPEPEARYGHVRYNSQTQSFEEYASNMQWEALDRSRQPAQKDRAETLRLLSLRDTARELIDAQRGPETSTEAREDLRARLRGQWEAYTEAFGPINRRAERLRTPSAKKQREILHELTRDWVAENQPQIEAASLEPEVLDSYLSPSDESPVIPAEITDQWRDQAKQRVPEGYTQDHLKALRSDPSLGVLLSIENMDRSTDQASPAAIMERDIVSGTAVATSAETSQEALGICMAERGHLDTGRIAELLGTSVEDLDTLLEGQVFTDPATGQLEPAARYLSGDVRSKLDAAAAAAESDPDFESNVAALRGVLPETIELDEITINPGVPWLEKRYYEEFAAEIFGKPVEITYDPHGQNGKWRIEAPAAGVSEDVHYQWGTSHRSVTPWSVLEKTLNSQVFRLTKPDPQDPENKRLPDPRASDAANDKADQLKARFRSWVGEDSDRAEQIQATYNRLFNSMVPADYSPLGDALEFPGLAADRKPYWYQRAAVARALNEPAVLLDHVVGAGKTGTMIMTAMEKRRLAHATKPAMVVPGHLVGQISAEWKQWYPEADVMAIPGGLKPAERREMFARAAAGDWDGVVLADTVFEDISIDPNRHMDMMSADIEEVRASVARMAQEEGASKAAIKKAEKTVKTLEKQYQKLADKPDAGLVFEQTGIDFLAVDEAHDYKNLGRLSDVPELEEATGSQKARNLDYILRAMREDKTARAKAEGTWSPGYIPSVALFSTGTPVANKVSEMWVMQHYLRPDLLVERSIDDVNAWGATFTEQDWRVIATPDGRYQRSLKVTGYANVPELLAFNRTFQDSVTRADLEVPLPAVIGGERHLHTLEPSPQVEEFMADLQERVDVIKRGGVDPSEDNVLKVVHEGRMAALDPRLIGLDAPGDGGRAAEVADQIMRVETETAQNTYTADTGEQSPIPGGLQLVFADLSTPKPAEPDRFTIYDQLRTELIERGMEPTKIAFIHQARTDAERVEMFRKARDGELSVLVGSTKKMGTGMNVQGRAVALHHIDPPWRPADMEQREGRIIRQGNQNTRVELHAYGTEGTTDTFMWSKLSQKAGFIEQLKNASGVGRTMEDPLAGIDATAANAQSVLSGDPRIGDLLTLESEITTLERLEHQHHAAQARARASIREHHRAIDVYEERLPSLRQLAATVSSTAGDRFVFHAAEGQAITTRTEAGRHLAAAVRRAAFIADQQATNPTDPVEVGTLGGVQLSVYRHLSKVHIATSVPGHDTTVGAEAVRNNNKTPEGLIRQVEHLVASTGEKVSTWEQTAEHHRSEAEKLDATSSDGWSKTDELEAKRKEYEELKADLGYTDEEQDPDSEPEPVNLTSDELAVLRPDGMRIEHYSEIRDGDVLRIKDGPAGTGYYNARRTTQEGSSAGVTVWPEDGTDVQAEELSYRAVLDKTVFLAARQRSTLTAMESRRIETHHDPSVRSVQIHAVQAGMRVQATDTDTGELVTGTIGFKQSANPIDQVQLVVDGESEPRRLRGHDNGLDLSPGLLQLDYEPHDQHHGSTDQKVNVSEIAYGAVLTEDVAGVGESGDLLVSMWGRYGKSPHRMNPETGEATPITGYGARVDKNQFREPMMLTAAEKRILGSSNEKLVGTVVATELRNGDRVFWRDLDKKATSGDPVTITHAHSRAYQPKASIAYRDGNGQRHSVDIAKDAEVRVIDRARAGLSITELAQLHCATSLNDQATASSAAVESLLAAEAHHGTGSPHVIISYTEDREKKVASGTVVGASDIDQDTMKVEITNREGHQSITANKSDTTMTVTPVLTEFSELNITGHHPVEASGEPGPPEGLERGARRPQQIVETFAATCGEARPDLQVAVEPESLDRGQGWSVWAGSQSNWVSAEVRPDTDGDAQLAVLRRRREDLTTGQSSTDLIHTEEADWDDPEPFRSLGIHLIEETRLLPTSGEEQQAQHVRAQATMMNQFNPNQMNAPGL